MAAVERSFRAESLMRVHTAVNEDPSVRDERRHQEVMAEIAALKKALARGLQPQEQPVDAEAVSQKFMQEFRKELSEAAKLKTELDSIYEAIAQTKKEIKAIEKQSH